MYVQQTLRRERKTSHCTHPSRISPSIDPRNTLWVGMCVKVRFEAVFVSMLRFECRYRESVVVSLSFKKRISRVYWSYLSKHDTNNERNLHPSTNRCLHVLLLYEDVKMDIDIKSLLKLSLKTRRQRFVVFMYYHSTKTWKRISMSRVYWNYLSKHEDNKSLSSRIITLRKRENGYRYQESTEVIFQNTKTTIVVFTYYYSSVFTFS